MSGGDRSKITPKEAFLGPLNRLKLQDLRDLGSLLQVSDPDMQAGQKSTQNLEKDLSRFRSITRLVANGNNGLLGRLQEAGLAILGSFADSWTSELQKLSVEDLLEILEELKAKAFRFDPNTGQLETAEKPLEKLRNILRGVERLASQDPKYLERITETVDLSGRPISEVFYDLSVLTSPLLTSFERESLLRNERGDLSYKEFYSHPVTRKDYVDALRNYDGSPSPFTLPYFKRNRLFTDYFRRHCPEETRMRTNKQLLQRHQAEDRALYAEMGLSPERMDYLSRQSAAALSEMSSAAFRKLYTIDTPEERKEILAEILFTNGHLLLKGRGDEWFIREAIKDTLSQLDFLRQRFSPKVFNQLNKPLGESYRAGITESPLDNIRARDLFIKGVTAAFKEELRRKGSFLAATNNDPFFTTYVGLFVTLAGNMGIPFSSDDLLQIADRAATEAGLITADRTDSLQWENSEEVKGQTIPFAAYPKSVDPWEDEMTLAKQIYYNGVSLYRLMERGIRTVTFRENIDGSLEKHTLGTAKGLFRNVITDVWDEEGSLRPVYERLEVLAHEAFHNLESLRTLSGYSTGGDYVPLLRERGAYLFGAHVLEEYLKLRIRADRRGDKELSSEEEGTILEIIVDCKNSARAANLRLEELLQGRVEKIAEFEKSGRRRFFKPPPPEIIYSFDPSDMEIEIPLATEFAMIRSMQSLNYYYNSFLPPFSRMLFLQETTFYNADVRRIDAEFLLDLGENLLTLESEEAEDISPPVEETPWEKYTFLLDLGTPQGRYNAAEMTEEAAVKALIEAERQRIYREIPKP